MAEKKYFWLKLKRDFYKRHDFKRIRSRGGSECALLYLMMMMESIDHDARLRYSDASPFTFEDLADAFDMDAETIERCMKVLIGAEVVEILDDGTIYLPICESLIGSECESAERVRNFRNRKAEENNSEQVTLV